MSVLPGVDTTLAGNLPGHILAFHRLQPSGALSTSPVVLSSDQYEAEISLTSDGLPTPNAATIVLVGLTDDDHATLARRTAGGAFDLSVVRVHLFWRDANASVRGYLANLLGLSSMDPLLGLAGGSGGPGSAVGGGADPLAAVRVAELSVSGVSRRRGARRYETVVTATSRVSARVAVALNQPLLSTFGRATADLGAIAGIDIDDRALSGLGPVEDLPFVAKAGERVGDVLARLGRQLEHLTRRHGRGMLLVRDQTLVVGPRPIPFGATWPLTWATGLLSIDAGPPQLLDPAADPETGAAAAAGALAGALAGAGGGTVVPARRAQWGLTLRGRPEIKPGDVVTFAAPVGESIEAGLADTVLGSFAAPLFGQDTPDPPTRGYVQSVKHSLSRGSGLITILSVLVLSETEDGWDRHDGPATSAGVRGAATPTAARPDAGGTLSDALDKRIAERIAAVDLAEVGEVRAQRATADGPDADGARLTIWHGTTTASDGQPHGAVRLPIETERPLRGVEVPYATPFAWGVCGLVLPRYPGTRVLSVFRNGSSDDPVEIGALWPSGQGAAAEPGDWWLGLPVGVPSNLRAAVADDTIVPAHRGAASNDLVDADGHRVIEVANLRVRVGSSGLHQAGTRPTAAPDDTLLSIEHSDGTTVLTISASGDVTVVAKGELTLKGAGITLDAGDDAVSISARSVAVHVQDEMTVT